MRGIRSTTDVTSRFRIGGDLNWFLAILIPGIVIGAIACLRRSALDLHHGALGLYSTRSAITLLLYVIG